MPRKRIPRTNINIGRRHDLQYRFLETTNRVCPEVVEDLKKVRHEQLQFERFVKQYDLQGTWIEKAARDTLDAWEHNQSVEAQSLWRLPVFAQQSPYGNPPFTHTQQLMESFHVPSFLFSPDRYKSAFHDAVDSDLDEISQWAVSEGYAVPKQIPTELKKKMECASLYLFRGCSSAQLAKKKGYATHPTNMWRWVSGVFKLLELPLRGRGNRGQKNCKERPG